MDPAALLDLVKDNVIVQWFLIVVFMLLVGTNTATKLKGPFGGAARWFRSIGEKRDEREAQERREKRLKLIQEATENREFVQDEIDQLKAQIGYLYGNQSSLETLIRAHLGWDYERIRDLIALGINPGDIPRPPPLRVELKDPDTVPQPKLGSRRRLREAREAEESQVQEAVD